MMDKELKTEMDWLKEQCGKYLVAVFDNHSEHVKLLFSKKLNNPVDVVKIGFPLGKIDEGEDFENTMREKIKIEIKQLPWWKRLFNKF
jgi:hypothetical protein